LAVVLQLLGPNGNRKFDGVSKTKTVATIINMFDVHTLGCYVQFLKLTFNAGKTDHDSLLKEDSCLAASQDVATRQWAIDQMLWLVHNVKLPRQDSWLLDIGKFMLFHAFFTVQDAVEGSLEVEMAPCLSLSPELREFCLQRFVSVLTELSHMPSLHKDTEGQSKGPHGTTSDGEFWLYHLMNFAEGIIQQNGKMSLHQPLSSKAHAALNASSTTIQSIREKAVHETNKAESRTFELLFLYTTLQLFSDQDQSVDVLQDLQTCYGKLQKSKLKGRKRRSLDTFDPEWVEVLTDILLSFLARSSQLTRNIADTVFRAIVEQVTKPALGLIVQAISAKKGRSEDGSDVEKDEDETDECDEEAASASEEEEASSEDVSDAPNADGDVDDDNDDDANREFREKVKTALGGAAVAETSTSESEDSNDDGDGDTSMDDDAMEAVDEALAEVFRERKLARADKKQKQGWYCIPAVEQGIAGKEIAFHRRKES
jgi:DNA polymerase phi